MATRRFRRLVATGLAATVLSFTPGVDNALAVDATWRGATPPGTGGPGNYNVGNNWSGGVVPNNNTFDVFIDGGKVADSPVTLNTSTTINSLTISTGDSLLFNNGQDLTIAAGGISNAGEIRLNGSGSDTDLSFTAAQTLGGAGKLTTTDASNNRILTSNVTVTHGAGHTIQGAGGLLVNTGGMINQGTIIADGTVNALVIDPNGLGFTNQGTMKATGSGGLTLLNGVFTNTGQTILAETGSKLTINNSTVVDGTLSTTGTGVIVILNSPVLSGVTIASTVTQANGQDVFIQNGLTNNGTWNNNAAGSDTDMVFTGAQTLGGTGTLQWSDNANNRLHMNNVTVTHGAGHTIQGAGQLLVNTGGMTNLGTILATGTNALVIDPNGLGFTNQGTMKATGSGGLTLLNGVFTNTGQTILAETGSKLTINNSTVVDGTLSTTGTGVIVILNSPTLSGVTIASTVTQANGQDVFILNGLTNNGTWNNNAAGSDTDMVFTGAQTLGGTGTLQWSNNNSNRIHMNNVIVTHGAGHTIQGAGQLLVNTGGMLNLGTIIATGTGANQILIDPNAQGFNNQGVLRANLGSTLRVADTLLNFSANTLTGGTYEVLGTMRLPVSAGSGIVTNRANIILDGVGSSLLDGTTSTSALLNFATNDVGGQFTIKNGRNFATTPGAFTNRGNMTIGATSTFSVLAGGTGTYTQESGTTTVDGTLDVGLLDLDGGVLAGTGTVAGNVQNDGGTVSPGSSAGTMTILGAYDQQVGGTLDIELAGFSEFDVLHVEGEADIDGTLNVKLIDGFNPNVDSFFDVFVSLDLDPLDRFLTENLPSSPNGTFSVLYLQDQCGRSDLDCVRIAFDARDQQVPVPPALLLVAIGLGAVAVRRRLE